jgi:ribosomal protein S27E
MMLKELSILLRCETGYSAIGLMAFGNSANVRCAKGNSGFADVRCADWNSGLADVRCANGDSGFADVRCADCVSRFADAFWTASESWALSSCSSR